MRVAFAFVLIGAAAFTAQADSNPFPDEAKPHHWRILDSSSRARTYQSWYTIPVTEAQFRKMKQQYRPHDFDKWAVTLRHLRPGMTEKQVLAILQPKAMDIQLAQNPGFSDIILLNDAYFAEAFFTDWPHRLRYVTTPLAITYEIKPSEKKFPKT